jgi:hypothetical protein
VAVKSRLSFHRVPIDPAHQSQSRIQSPTHVCSVFFTRWSRRRRAHALKRCSIRPVWQFSRRRYHEERILTGAFFSPRKTKTVAYASQFLHAFQFCWKRRNCCGSGNNTTLESSANVGARATLFASHLQFFQWVQSLNLIELWLSCTRSCRTLGISPFSPSLTTHTITPNGVLLFFARHGPSLGPNRRLSRERKRPPHGKKFVNRWLEKVCTLTHKSSFCIQSPKIATQSKFGVSVRQSELSLSPTRAHSNCKINTIQQRAKTIGAWLSSNTLKSAAMQLLLQN